MSGACKAVVIPLVAAVEAFSCDEHRDEQVGGQTVTTTSTGGAKYYLAMILQIGFVIFAGYLAWQCNAGQSGFMRIVYTLLAAVFNVFYLAYYLIYRVLMGNKCIVGVVINP